MKLIIFVSMSKIRFIYFLILSLLPSYIYAQKSDSGFSSHVGIAILILLIIVLFIFYLIRQEKKEAQKKRKEAQKIKDYEDYQLKLEKDLEGLISESINYAYKEKIKEIFGIRSYNIGYYEPSEYGSNKVKTKISSIEEIRWTDANGNLLKDSVYMCQLLNKKLYSEHRKIRNKIKVNISQEFIMRPPSGYEKKSIFIINGVYFSQDDCSWVKSSIQGLTQYTRYRFAEPTLFNGKINGIEYVDGYPDIEINDISTTTVNHQDYVKSLIKYIKDEMNKTGQAWPISYFKLLFCKISFKDSENNTYVGQELRIQPGYKDDDKEIVELDSQIYTDSLCSQNSNGDLILITNGPSPKEDIQDLNHGNTEWYNWNDMIGILNKAKRINLQDLDDNLKSDFTYLDY